MMKKIITISLVLAMSSFAFAETWTDPETGIEWKYTVVDGNAEVGNGATSAVASEMEGDLVIPSFLGSRKVVSVGSYAFLDCSNMTSVVISEGVTNVSSSAFKNCVALTNVVIPASIRRLHMASFWGCALMSVRIPKGIVALERGAFTDCPLLADVYFEGDDAAALEAKANPNLFACPFNYCNWDMIIHVPSSWKGRGKTLCGYTVVRDGVVPRQSGAAINLVITNIVVHYIQTSEQSPMTAPITEDAGIVNVITEIKGGNVAIPETWVSNYPTFTTKYGSDFSAALTRLSGKKDAAGNPMMVWQDYVAGTDPTDEKSVFRASVTMVDGVPVVSYTPELTAEEKAKRKYTTLGKVKLQDSEWVEVTSGREADYNFFKVTVEMK